MTDMTRDGLARTVAHGLDGPTAFNEMGIDSQNDILEGVDALLTLYQENPTPDKDTIMSVFASAFENTPSDISEWDEDYKREMRNVAEFVNIYARVSSGDAATTIPRPARRSARRITEEAEMAEPTVAPIVSYADSFAGGDPVNDLAILLMRAWGKADPGSNVSQHPVSYVANFADMARAVLETYGTSQDEVDKDTLALIRRGIADPGSVIPRGDNYEESITSWSARAVAALGFRRQQPMNFNATQDAVQ